MTTTGSTNEPVRSALYASRPETAPAAPSADGGAAALVLLGIEHILMGYDHLFFLLALVLLDGSLRSILGIVTTFTVAHSVTLAVAALGVWAPPATLVEPAIALSIAYVGVENCLAPDLRRRWRLSFAFGLVHGFGFAGALHDLDVSAAELPVALASFNVGVEAGPSSRSYCR